MPLNLHHFAPSLSLLALLTACATTTPEPAAEPTPVTPSPEVPDETPADTPSLAATDPDFALTVANIMRGQELVGRWPSELRWSPDSRHVYFRWREPAATDTITHTYRVAVGEDDPEQLPDSVADRVAPSGAGSWTPDRRWQAFERRGDIYVANAEGRELRITDTPIRHRAPHLSPDGRTVYFLTGDDLFAVEVEGGSLRQLTDIRTEDEPDDEEAAGQQGFLEEQERELIGAVRDRIEEREHGERVDSMRTRVHPTYIGDRRSVTTAEVSPSGRFLLLGVSEESRAERTLVPNFITEDGYTETLNARPKVGDEPAAERLALIDLEGGSLVWVEPVPEDREPTARAVGWAPDRDRALVVTVPRDFKDRWIHTLDPDGELTEIDHLRDDAWVGGPGLFTAGWLPDGERVYFVSERTGYAHLYTAPAMGGEATAVTGGDWEVHEVEISADGESFHITTSEEHPGRRALYAVSTEGGERRRLTPLEGWTTGRVSPDERWIALLHATADRPPELHIMPHEPGGVPRRITRSITDEYRSGPWLRPEVLSIPAGDGEPVYARIYRPEEVGAERTGAAVLFVHGAGYLQNAHYGWSTYFREYMFHHLLAARGYVVLDIDYRGSAGYGRDWRTGIYRHMGGLDLTDHVDAAGWLVENEGVDPGRIGLYGGSYGGFITLMAMFTEPEVFRAGAALRSVTDWAHYNHPYTSRILNEPQDDPEAYRRSSPIHFAEGLEGHLLITHGMVDTNVQFQDVVRLSQRLIELGKENWEMAVYPVEPHAFERPDSWTDQYRRILELFERTIGAAADG